VNAFNLVSLVFSSLSTSGTVNIVVVLCTCVCVRVCMCVCGLLPD